MNNMKVAPPFKILHVITGLGTGGAEMALTRLLSRLDRETFACQVVSLTGDQPLGETLRSMGIPVTALGFRPGMPDPRMLPRLSALIREYKPQLVQTWMYHSDLIGGLAARRAAPVVWGIRHTVAERGALKPATWCVAHVNALLSHSLPVRIVCNAESGRLSHIRMGYAADRMIVIPNGFDTGTFRPDPSARESLRRELGLLPEVLLVGLCARFHPHKDHRTFLRAAGILHQQMPEVHFVLWGKDIDLGNTALADWSREAGLGSTLHCLGPRTDSARLFAAVDLAALSSFTEAFPSVVGEAMACGVPCAATDAGDARTIISDTGSVVPIRAPQELAHAMLELLAAPAERRRLGELARARIVAHYSLERMALSYAGLYRDIITGGQA